MRFFGSSDVYSLTLRDGHKYTFAAKSRRIAAPAYGDNARTIPFLDVDCLSCVADLQEPRHGWSTKQSDVPKTLGELDYELGLSTKSKATMNSLLEQLQALAGQA